MKKKFMPVDYSKSMERLERTYRDQRKKNVAEKIDEVPTVEVTDSFYKIDTQSITSAIVKSETTHHTEAKMAAVPIPATPVKNIEPIPAKVFVEEKEIEDDGLSF